MTRRPLSIRSRLLVLLSGATVILWIVAVAMSYFDARRELNELFDAQLAESAEVLLRQATHEVRDAGEKEGPRGAPAVHGIEHPYAQQLHFQIWDRGGSLVYRSSDDLPPQPLVEGMPTGYADRTLHGVRWRVAVLTDPQTGLQIQLCQRHDAREGVAAAIARNMFTPLAAALPILALLIWVATGSGIRPLGRFSSELERRTPDNLQPIADHALPRELEPVASALNQLLARLRDRLDLERRFTADAAHELRTPLAALKTQAQVALGARDDEERTHALSQIVRGTDRMTHLVTQLLTLARVDPVMAEEAAEPVDLALLVREAARDLTPLAEEKKIALESAVAGSPIVSGSRALLATLVRNLLENAVLYGRRDGLVRSEIEERAADVRLHVIDNGPGIAPGERERVFDRFFRGAGTRERGSGLGLSIVKRIADLHGGAVMLEDASGGGLHVIVQLPRGTRK